MRDPELQKAIDEIEIRRKKLGWTKSFLSEQAGMQRDYWSHLLSPTSHSSPTALVMIRIQGALVAGEKSSEGTSGEVVK